MDELSSSIAAPLALAAPFGEAYWDPDGSVARVTVGGHPMFASFSILVRLAARAHRRDWLQRHKGRPVAFGLAEMRAADGAVELLLGALPVASHYVVPKQDTFTFQCGRCRERLPAFTPGIRWCPCRLQYATFRA